MAPLGFPKPIKKDDERLKGHETVYSSSRGGHYPRPPQPAPGQPRPRA
ncbi:hypothetical protein KVH22_25365 [Streptomyces olivaceus]|nr:hypothetical protein [Streptomyces olivaceus]MBZ6258848.1 hypothetical protein [Streptomyces olivaceus]